MIAAIKSRAMGWALGGLALLSAYLCWQHVTAQRDAYQAEAVHQRERAEILQEHQQWQRQQIQTLNTALAERERTLTIIANDMRASTAALERLGETDAESRAWLDSDLPAGVRGWLRELQHPGAHGGVRLPGSPPPPGERATRPGPDPQ